MYIYYKLQKETILEIPAINYYRVNTVNNKLYCTMQSERIKERFLVEANKLKKS